ncbi:hypothetical protein SAMN04488029_2105 [Reichenbachiella faecimaris]|uniref:Major facilitator superfamily (MFS) profile domain-containing protein n=2 Tax=Reichenbachiella faecimaris TaxID=692418 RepID=A0A1W2GD91_REIFA|nr:hypothetical protein SAMN04488029_2105 [Reichenbachiella faecimaris]
MHGMTKSDMKTKILMILSVAYLSTQGVLFTFLPQEVNAHFGQSTAGVGLLISQTLGAALLAFALLNWMTRSNILGGIYGKPLMMANFLFFFASGMSYLKAADSPVVWVMAAISMAFGFSFGYVAFTHPFKTS